MTDNNPTQADGEVAVNSPEDMDDTMAEEWSDKLSDQINDGGGCAESWEALSARRDADDGRTSRRGFIKAASALGISATTLSQMVSRAEATARAVNVSSPTGSERRSLIGRAMSNQKFQQVSREFKQQGYRPSPDDAQIATSEMVEKSAPHDVQDDILGQNGESWETVVVPFNPTGEEERVYISWSTAPSNTPTVEGIQWERHTPQGEEPYWEIEQYTVGNDGEISLKTDEMLNFLGCNNPDVGCIALIAGAYATEFVACATCGASAGWLIPACGYCIGAVLTAYGTVSTCDWCKD